MQRDNIDDKKRTGLFILQKTTSHNVINKINVCAVKKQYGRFFSKRSQKKSERYNYRESVGGGKRGIQSHKQSAAIVSFFCYPILMFLYKLTLKGNKVWVWGHSQIPPPHPTPFLFARNSKSRLRNKICVLLVCSQSLIPMNIIISTHNIRFYLLPTCNPIILILRCESDLHTSDIMLVCVQDNSLDLSFIVDALNTGGTHKFSPYIKH